MKISFADMITQEEKPAENEKQVEKLSGKRVLLVEDNDLNVEITEALLDELHVESFVAKNGQEAVDIFQSSSPDTFDFVLMDNYGAGDGWLRSNQTDPKA